MPSAATSTLRGAARRARATARSLRSRLGSHRRDRDARALVAAGLVDRPWLERQSGRTLQDDLSAARWFLHQGAEGGASPHRLFEPEWADPLPSHAADVTVRAAADLAAVRRAHPLTDGGAGLAATLRGLGPATPLTFEDRSLTYAQWADVVDAAEDLRRAQSTLGGRRTSPTWDTAADARYVARWSGAPLPSADGPVVSVVMPVRNRPVLVAEAIESVRRQTLETWELLVVDDGSDDTTPDVVAELARQDPRVRLIRQAQSGVCAARNAGIDAATGAYVAFLDSDNTWVEPFLRVAVAAMHGQRLDAAFAVVDEVSERGHRYRTFAGDTTHLQVGNFVDLNVLIVRTPLLREIGGFDPTLRRMVDYDLAWRLATRTRLTLLPFVGVRYTAHAEAGDRISAVESFAWDDVVKARHLVDWPSLRAGADGRDEQVVSVVVTPGVDRAAAVRTVRAVLHDPAPEGTTLDVVVVAGSWLSPGSWRLLHAEVGLDDGVTLLRTPGPLNRAASASLGLARTRGSVVVVLPAGAVPLPGVVDELVRPVRSGEVAASMATDGRDGIVAIRASALIAVGGLDPLFADEFEVDDLVLRLAEVGEQVVRGPAAVLPPTGIRRPDPVQHRANEREWVRRHPGVPVPTWGSPG